MNNNRGGNGVDNNPNPNSTPNQQELGNNNTEDASNSCSHSNLAEIEFLTLQKAPVNDRSCDERSVCEYMNI